MNEHYELLERLMTVAHSQELAARAGRRVPRPNRGGPLLRLGEHSEVAGLLQEAAVALTAHRLGATT